MPDLSESSKLLDRELHSKMRALWLGIIADVQDPDALMPPGISENRKMLALCYYVMLIQTVGDALKGLLAEEEKVVREESRLRASAKPRRHFDNRSRSMSLEEVEAESRELDDGLRAGKLVYRDDVLTNLDAVFEAFRNDLLAVPFGFTESDASALTADRLRDVCERELARVIDRFQDEMAQSIEGAVRAAQQSTRRSA